MPFAKGNKLSKGRPVGALNRSTEQMKLTLARAVNNTLDTISKDLEEIKKKDPEKAIELALKLMEYTMPKLSRMEMKAEVEQKIHQISVNIQDGITNQHIENIS
jgi:hypothetical protein